MASCISPKGDLRYMIRNKPFDSAAIIEYLRYLLAEFNQNLIIIWAGGVPHGASIHDSKEVRTFLDTLPQGKLFLAQQPHYSPELNADEQVWYHLKNYKLKNTCNQNVNELQPKITKVMDDLKNNTDLIKNFFKHPELGFYN
jgi:transposase